MQAGHHLPNTQWAFLTELWFMGHCLGLDDVNPQVGSRRKAPKALTILRYLKLENS